MDAALLLSPTQGSVGVDWDGDFDLSPEGRIIRRAGPKPYVYSGVGLIKPQLFAQETQDVFKLAPFLFEAAEKGRLFGVVAQRALAACRHGRGHRGRGKSDRRRAEVSFVKRNVFTIAPGAPFLATFVDALLAGEIVPSLSRETAPLDMARATIYVPTRRAGRALAAEFAKAIGKGATFLPRILPLGGLDEQETAAVFGDFDADFFEAAKPQIEELERRLLLAQLVHKWSEAVEHAILFADGDGNLVRHEGEPFLVASSPTGAYALAAELGALIDEFVIEDVDRCWDRTVIDDASFDKYWSITTTFLGIALESWPKLLEEQGRVDAAVRRKLLIEAQIASLATAADQPPVIAIGSTGAQPTTARLLSAIAAHENGAVVLPGLDKEMGEAAWAQVGEGEGEPAFTHPQTMLKRLLGHMKLKRDDVRELGNGCRRRSPSVARSSRRRWRRRRRPRPGADFRDARRRRVRNRARRRDASRSARRANGGAGSGAVSARGAGDARPHRRACHAGPHDRAPRRGGACGASTSTSTIQAAPHSPRPASARSRGLSRRSARSISTRSPSHLCSIIRSRVSVARRRRSPDSRRSSKSACCA